MNNITTLNDAFWNQFVGERGSVNVCFDIRDDGKVLLSCENNNKLFNTDTYSDIPAYVKSLAKSVSSVEFLTNIDRFPAWQALLEQVNTLAGVESLIFVSVNLDTYFANDKGSSQSCIDRDLTKLDDVFNPYDLFVSQFQLFMDLLDQKTISDICDCSEINEDEWIRIISWVGEHNCLSDFIRFLHEQVYPAMPMHVANHVWLKLSRNGSHDRLKSSSQARKKIDDNHELKSRLNTHLDHIPCAVMWHRLSAYLEQILGLNTSDYLSDKNRKLFDKWARQPILDQQALSIAKEWYTTPALAEALEFNGVQMGDCFVYELTSDVLEFCLNSRKDQSL